MLGKIIINGQIKALTGLAIGGSKSDMTIGGIDNNVIKTSEGVPFIPGSSLKGKLRSLLERKNNKEKICNCGKKDCEICVIFGTGMKSKKEEEVEAGLTRLYVRDAFLYDPIKKEMENKEGIFSNLELAYTEVKWENTISRLKGKANNPRQQERVPAGSVFEMNLIYNLMIEDDIDMFKHLMEAMRLLEDDYIGGNGSRGYGRIKFENLEIICKKIADYKEGNSGTAIYSGHFDTLDQKEVIQKIKEVVGDEGQ
ncbi:type III-A CRISPR-associated RAMP protein Csm3 [Fervidibacillus halotolerans]|uniref:CRISPR system Cms endoribonuclease Csm3 n=1 Tax=Fervidibacillus halotolerans TaxID=2980027 RepID=A0A9E8LZR4_9BACI|nr:type III-A CRISPR-associated RAMP protein Csm3 [Fervidibacillus halotolerans]WAA11981.1 type III-A CRISPR-associated RAMP protein Csm3 [Fervidibacillus halotolerans]